MHAIGTRIRGLRSSCNYGAGREESVRSPMSKVQSPRSVSACRAQVERWITSVDTSTQTIHEADLGLWTVLQIDTTLRASRGRQRN